MKRVGFVFLLTAAFLISGAWAPPVDAAEDALVQAAKKEGKVVVYHSMSRKALKAMAIEFESKFGIKVQWTRKGTGGITRMVTAEKMSGKLRCDVVSLGDPSTFIRWTKENYLMKHLVPNDPAMMQNLVDPKGYALPDRADYMSIGYNINKVSASELPKSWLDVLDPKWKGRIAMIDPKKSGPARIWMGAMVKKFGWDYFRKLAKNKPLALKSYSTSAVAMVSGEVDIVIPGNESDILKRNARGEPVNNIYPTEGVVFRSARVGVCAKAPHPNAARLWVRYEVSAEGQALLHKVRGYVPIRSDVAVSTKRPANATKNMMFVDPAWFGKNKRKMLKKYSRIMAGKE